MVAKAGNWERTEALVHLVRQLFSSMGGSHLAETGFQRLRAKELAGGNQNKKLSFKSRWARLVDSRLASEDHSFEEVPWSQTSSNRGEHFHDVGSMFQPSKAQQPPELKAVASSARTPPWHSPAPLLAVQQVVELDLYLRHQFHLQGSWAFVDNLWLCLLMDVQSQLLVRDTTAHGAETWYFVLGEMGGRAAVGWPAVLVKSEGKEFFRLKDSIVESDLCFLYTHTVSDLQARSFSWKSPAYLAATGVSPDMGAMALASGTGTLLEASARAAFGKLGLTSLRQVAHFQGIECAGKDMFEVLRLLISDILPNLSDVEVLSVLKQRLEVPQLFEDILLDENFADHLEAEGDVQDLAEVQLLSADRKEKMKSEDLFKLSFKRAAVLATERARSAASSSQATKHPRGQGKKARGAAGKRQPTKPPPMTEQLSEAELALWLPDASHRIYKDTFNCRWLWFHDSRPRKSCSWLKWGFLKGALQLVHAAWDHHQVLGGDPPDFILPGVEGTTQA